MIIDNVMGIAMRPCKFTLSKSIWHKHHTTVEVDQWIVPNPLRKPQNEDIRSSGEPEDQWQIQRTRCCSWSWPCWWRTCWRRWSWTPSGRRSVTGSSTRCETSIQFHTSQPRAIFIFKSFVFSNPSLSNLLSSTNQVFKLKPREI